MSQTMGLDGVKALVVEHGLQVAVGGRIALDRGDDVGAKHLADARLVFQRIRIGLADQFAGDLDVIEPLRQAMHDRRLERVVMQDRRIDEAGDLGLATHRLFRLVADAPPGRIDRAERGLGPMLCHDGFQRDLSHPIIARPRSRGDPRAQGSLPRKPRMAAEKRSLRSPATMCLAPATSIYSACGTSSRNSRTWSSVTSSDEVPRTSMAGMRMRRAASTRAASISWRAARTGRGPSRK